MPMGSDFLFMLGGELALVQDCGFEFLDVLRALRPLRRSAGR